ncbi:hypothetical protein OCU_47960 [Mycobacterium intracellulare ATCC 13950]|uniref:Uncharacterized protein n=1 Tax=Mycobacterium intracellulare (strain ATCC 13950 / DSM 43223 / JCM 6384 / NCTC 13025 / 3600) TaxID=487521 RepID=H8IX23_MYCIA|nr:hypothetical protein OCU_47960 [Mycobacterium intracellulare ATCC 13950]
MRVTDPGVAPGAGLLDEHPAESAEDPASAATPEAPASCKNPRRFHPCRIA